MKIGTWNLERLKHNNKISEISALLEKQDCDVLVLTEYDEKVKLSGFQYEHTTLNLIELDAQFYRISEKRVKIFSKYKIIKSYTTFDSFTSCCAELETPYGNLIVYGTIIGVFGNRNQNFKDDLPKQLNDFKMLSAKKNLCVIGDFNISFYDNYYYTKLGRYELDQCFEECGIIILTKYKDETIDHIAISEKFVANTSFIINEWNVQKELSDHKGISVKLNKG